MQQLASLECKRTAGGRASERKCLRTLLHRKCAPDNKRSLHFFCSLLSLFSTQNFFPRSLSLSLSRRLPSFWASWRRHALASQQFYAILRVNLLELQNCIQTTTLLGRLVLALAHCALAKPIGLFKSWTDERRACQAAALAGCRESERGEGRLRERGAQPQVANLHSQRKMHALSRRCGRRASTFVDGKSLWLWPLVGQMKTRQTRAPWAPLLWPLPRANIDQVVK